MFDQMARIPHHLPGALRIARHREEHNIKHTILILKCLILGCPSVSDRQNLKCPPDFLIIKFTFPLEVNSFSVGRRLQNFLKKKVLDLCKENRGYRSIHLGGQRNYLDCSGTYYFRSPSGRCFIKLNASFIQRTVSSGLYEVWATLEFLWIILGKAAMYSRRSCDAYFKVQ